MHIFALLCGIICINLFTCKYCKLLYFLIRGDVGERRAAAEARAEMVKQREEAGSATVFWKKISSLKEIQQTKYDAVLLKITGGYPRDLHLNQKVRIKGVAGVPEDQDFVVIKVFVVLQS